MKPVANLPSVSTTTVANCHGYQWHRRGNCCRCQRHWWQIMGTISDCWHLKVNMKEKKVIYVNSTSQRCPKNNENFSDWRFFPFATGVNHTVGAPWAENISANFLNKFETALMVYFGARGKLIHEKNLKSKISWRCNFKVNVLVLLKYMFVQSWYSQTSMFPCFSSRWNWLKVLLLTLFHFLSGPLLQFHVGMLTNVRGTQTLVFLRLNQALYRPMGKIL